MIRHAIQLDDKRIMICVYTTNGPWEMRTHSLEDGRELSRAALKGQPYGIIIIIINDLFSLRST